MAKVSFRCTDDQREFWGSLAKSDGRKLGDWIKRQLPVEDMSVPWSMPLPAVPKVKAVSLPSMREKPSDPLQEMEANRVADAEERLSVERACSHKPFKRKDGLTVCEKCGVRL